MLYFVPKGKNILEELLSAGGKIHADNRAGTLVFISEEVAKKHLLKTQQEEVNILLNAIIVMKKSEQPIYRP